VHLRQAAVGNVNKSGPATMRANSSTRMIDLIRSREGAHDEINQVPGFGCRASMPDGAASIHDGAAPRAHGARRVIALGALLIVIGFVPLIPRGTFPGSTAIRNIPMGPYMFRTPGYQNNPKQSLRGKLVGVLVALGLIALGALCIELGS